VLSFSSSTPMIRACNGVKLINMDFPYTTVAFYYHNAL
jgi:hypothetical protein